MRGEGGGQASAQLSRLTRGLSEIGIAPLPGEDVVSTALRAVEEAGLGLPAIVRPVAARRGQRGGRGPGKR